MRKTLLTFALATSTIAAAACSAQSTPGDTPARGPGQRGAAMMMRADANNDGVITRAEAIAEADARFAKLDTNGDGSVSADEVSARRDAMRDRMEARGNAPRGGDRADMGRHRDPDGDGVMTKSDAEARAIKRFDRMDANHDGKLDRTELANFSELRRVKHREMRGGADTPPPAPADDTQ